MNIKVAAMAFFALPLAVVAATSAIVSGSTDRSPTHSGDSPNLESGFDLRAGTTGTGDYIATQENGFEAREWSCFDVELESLNCLPTGMSIIIK